MKSREEILKSYILNDNEWSFLLKRHKYVEVAYMAEKTLEFKMYFVRYRLKEFLGLLFGRKIRLS